MEAKKLMDLFRFKSYWRYLKKGIALGILTSAITYVIALILSAINGGIPLRLGATTQFGALSGAVLIALTVAWVVYGLVAGFLVEYINNGTAQLIKWLNK